jgi:hypothetical protein
LVPIHMNGVRVPSYYLKKTPVPLHLEISSSQKSILLLILLGIILLVLRTGLYFVSSPEWTVTEKLSLCFPFFFFFNSTWTIWSLLLI